MIKNPLVQVLAIDQYEKSNKSTSKDYPSLELVRLEKLFFKEKKGKVLEYAFGSGCNTKHLLKKNYTVFGIDVSKNAIINLKKKLKNKKIKKKLKLFLLNRNAKKIPFKSKTFDYVVAMSILSLLGSKQKITYLLKELNRVLKKDGKIILDVNDQNSEFSKNNLTKITSFLNTDKTVYTKTVMDRERCPRKIDMNERAGKFDEIKKSATTDSLIILQEMVDDYEMQASGKF